jgi:hypothetical protein
MGILLLEMASDQRASARLQLPSFTGVVRKHG